MQAFRREEATMTPEEAQAVVRRHLEAIPPGATGPNVADVAEALGVPPEEVARLLDEVRRTPKVAPATRKFPVWSVPLGIVAGLALLSAIRATMPTQTVVPATVATQSTEVFEITMEGIGERTTDPILPNADALLPVLTMMAQPEMATASVGTRSASDAEAATCLANIARGEWSGPDLVEREVTIRHFGSSGKFVRWVRMKLPFYQADDPQVEEACAKERERRLAEAIRTAGTPLPSGGEGQG